MVAFYLASDKKFLILNPQFLIRVSPSPALNVLRRRMPMLERAGVRRIWKRWMRTVMVSRSQNTFSEY